MRFYPQEKYNYTYDDYRANYPEHFYLADNSSFTISGVTSHQN